MTYIIESVRTVDGGPHEREARRKGHRVNIVQCSVGSRLIYTYPDDDNGIVRTSSIQDVITSPGELVVWTRNTVYTFRKEVAQ